MLECFQFQAPDIFKTFAIQKHWKLFSKFRKPSILISKAELTAKASIPSEHKNRNKMKRLFSDELLRIQSSN